MVRLNDIISIYEDEVRVNVRNKKKIYEFEKYKMIYIMYIYNILESNSYDGGRYNIFLIYYPKVRLIMSQNIIDKIINHYVSRYILEKKLSCYLKDFNVATRRNMGIDYGIRLLKRNIERNKKYSNFYFLKLDIYKYFYNIDHGVLKSLLIDKLDGYEYELVSKIIDSTNLEYINKYIDRVKDKYSDIINYEYGKGLPIGNMTSQFLAVFYLYKLHHYIVNNLKVRDIVVYMDDYVLIHHDREYLKYVRDEIIRILNNEYCLKVNENKTYIRSCKEGISFLGYNIKVVNNKTIFDISKSSRIKIKKNIKRIRYLYENDKISFNRAFTSVNVIKNSFKYGNSIKIKNIIDRYWF